MFPALLIATTPAEAGVEESIVLVEKSGRRLAVELVFANQNKVAFRRSDGPRVFQITRHNLTDESNASVDVWRREAKALEPGKSIELGVFNREYWQEVGTKPIFYPWEGRKVVLFTLEDTHDPKVMGKYLHYLDQGWEIMEYVTGGYPVLSHQSKLFGGKGIIRCAPSAKYLKAEGLGW